MCDVNRDHKEEMLECFLQFSIRLVFCNIHDNL